MQWHKVYFERKKNGVNKIRRIGIGRFKKASGRCKAGCMWMFILDVSNWVIKGKIIVVIIE